MDCEDLEREGCIFTWWTFWRRKDNLHGSKKSIWIDIRKRCGIDATKKTYGWKNSEKEFRRNLLRAFTAMRCRRSNADPCMYLSGQQWDCWHGCHGLVTVNFWKRWWSRESEEQNDEVIWLWWCRKYGRVFGCKINGYNGFNFNHPVRLKIFRNEFALPKHVHTTPVIPGKWLNPWKRMLIHLKRQHNLVREWRSCYTWQYGQDQKLTIRCDTCHTKWVWRQRST